MKARLVEYAVSILVSGIMATVFIYNTFQTKAEAGSFMVSMEKRLDRIEEKLDKLILRSSQ